MDTNLNPEIDIRVQDFCIFLHITGVSDTQKLFTRNTVYTKKKMNKC